MRLLKQIQQGLSINPGERFVYFDELYEDFPGSKADHFRPINPVDLTKIPPAAKAAGLLPFSKRPGEGGIWFKLL
jgi:hypothetical protein